MPQSYASRSDWFSEIEDAQTVDDPANIKWDDKADVIVVGYGGAGVSCALQAVEDGASVIALDRFEGGGSTAVNGGIFYAGGGTAAQKEAGVEDSAENMYNYLRHETQGVVKDETLRRFCEGSAGDYEWMARHGVRFSGGLYSGKTSYPHTSYYLYHSDSSLAAPYRDLARPAARGHRAFLPENSSAEGYGIGLYAPLRDSAEAAGVRVRRRADVRRLVLDREGRVIGVAALWFPQDAPEATEYARLVAQSVKWTRMLPPAYPGATMTRGLGERLMRKARLLEAKAQRWIFIRARKGVVLSTGGFIYNRDMIRHYAPNFIDGMPQGTAGDSGAGIRLGETAGGATSLMHHLSAWRFLNPPLAWARGILVSARGERMVNETYYGAAIGEAIVAKNGGKAWLVIDMSLYKDAWKQVWHKEVLPFQRYPAMLAMMFGRCKAKSLDALARKMGFDPVAFGETVASYNRAAKGEVIDPFGKSGDELHALERGPFYAIDMSISAKLEPLPVMTLGGLKVEEESGLVIRADGTPIAGLYAAGRTAVGICSHIYVSGLAVADCVFSGRRAGRHAARAGASA